MFNQRSPFIRKVLNLSMAIVFLIVVIIPKLLTSLFIFEIDYSAFLLVIIPSGTFLGLSFLVSIANWIDQKN